MGIAPCKEPGILVSAMNKKVKKGLVIVNTGNGKGKSTSAFGVLLRAWGRGFRVCVVQFIKAETGQWGEIKAAKKLGIDWFTTGDGFTWTSKDMDETVARARNGWEIAKGKMLSRQRRRKLPPRPGSGSWSVRFCQYERRCTPDRPSAGWR